MSKLRDARAILVLLVLAVTADLRGQGIRSRRSQEESRPRTDLRCPESPFSRSHRRSRVCGRRGRPRPGRTFSGCFCRRGRIGARFSAPGMQPVEREVIVSAAAAAQFDVAMSPASVTEAVTVSAEAATSRGMAVGTSIPQKLLSESPSERTLRSAVLLAAGVNDKEPKGAGFLEGAPSAVTISGAPSFENLYLVNGVVVNDNDPGDPQNLFIEDAIAETVVETGRITAEYGRFTGGVVNVVTRSGGNRISGSFRTTFHDEPPPTANDRYNRSLGIDNRVDDVNETYEATLGFPVWRDRLWGFTAGRWADVFHSDQTRADLFPGDVDPTPVPYVYGDSERRLEAKLDGSNSPRATT